MASRTVASWFVFDNMCRNRRADSWNEKCIKWCGLSLVVH